jgi:hypothetical protein
MPSMPASSVALPKLPKGAMEAPVKQPAPPRPDGQRWKLKRRLCPKLVSLVQAQTHTAGHHSAKHLTRYHCPGMYVKSNIYPNHHDDCATSESQQVLMLTPLPTM